MSILFCSECLHGLSAALAGKFRVRLMTAEVDEATRAQSERIHFAFVDFEQAGHRICKQETPGQPWHCAKCGKRMQFFDGICFDCNGGRDPGD